MQRVVSKGRDGRSMNVSSKRVERKYGESPCERKEMRYLLSPCERNEIYSEVMKLTRVFSIVIVDILPEKTNIEYIEA